MAIFGTRHGRREVMAAVLSLLVTSGALAQQQEFRDPKTGRVWTPDNVGRGTSGPTTPQDRAFDPRGQTVISRGATMQTPSVSVLGAVPITVGPTVPVAVIDIANLSAIPAQRWQIVLSLNNNSPGTIIPVIDCAFTNAGNPVETVRANLPPVAGGQRVGFTIYGPQTNLFVDHADCRLASW